MDKKLIFTIILILGGFFSYKYLKPQEQVQVEKVVIEKEKIQPEVPMTFLRVKGKVTIEKNGNIQDAVEGLAINQNFSLTSYENSFAILAYGKAYSSKIKLGANSSFDLSTFDLGLPEQKDGYNFKLSSGSLLLDIFNPGKKKVLRVKTNTVALGIRGTNFIVKSEEDNSLLVVREGTVEIESDDEMKKPTYAYADNAFSINSDKEIKAESMSNFNIEWNMDADNIEFITTEYSFSDKIFSALKILNQKLMTLDAEQIEEEKILTKLNKAASIEFEALEKDNKCLSQGLNDCLLDSNIYTLGLIKGRLPKNLVTKKNINIMIEDIANRKSEVMAKINLSKDKNEHFILEHQKLKNKYFSAKEKWSEFLSFDESKKSKMKYVTYAEIVKIIDDSKLSAEFEKVKE